MTWRTPTVLMVAAILTGCQPAALSRGPMGTGPGPGEPATSARTPRLLAGGEQVLVLDGAGTAWQWGLDATSGDALRALARPTAVTGPHPWRALAASEADGVVPAPHVLAARDDGTVWAWGANAHGQGGHAAAAAAEPVQVPGLTDVVDVEAGSRFSLALRADGSVWGWGRNGSRQLGERGAEQAGPGAVPGLAGVVMVRAGRHHALALGRDGQVWAWGANDAGQLGMPPPARQTGPDDARRAAPAPVPGLTGVVEIAAAGDYGLARLADGGVMGWGRGRDGELGRAPAGSAIARAPLAVPGLRDVRALAAGDRHALALGADGRVWSWGGNALGELGRGSPAPGALDATPAPVEGLPAAVAIAAGRHLRLALDGTGRIWAWGSNAAGQGGRGAAGREGLARPQAVRAPAGEQDWKVAL